MFQPFRVLNVFNPNITFHKYSSFHLSVIGGHFVVLYIYVYMLIYSDRRLPVTKSHNSTK